MIVSLRAGGDMRICASCGETYPEEVERCDLDGTVLCSWEEATRVVLGPADDVAVAVHAGDEEDSTSERPTVPRLRHDSARPARPTELRDPSPAKLAGRVRFSDAQPAFASVEVEDTG